MRFFIIFLSIAALACTKKAEPKPADAVPSAAVEQPEGTPEGEPDEPPPEPKLEDKLGAELAKADDDLPETLQGVAPPVGAPAALALVEAGKEPKAPLRYRLPERSEQRVAIDVGMATEAAVAVIAVRNPEFVVSFDLAMQTGKRDRKGRVPVTFSVADATIDLTKMGDGKVVKLLEEAMTETVPKLGGRFRIGPTGHVDELEVDVAKDAKKYGQDIADGLRLSILQLTPALPEQPIGLGAKWTAHEAIEQAGAVVNQLRTFELVGRDAESATLEVSVRQTADRQPYESQGTKYELETLSGDGAGTLTWNATTLLPTAADYTASTIEGLRHESKDGRAIGVARKITRSVRMGGEK